MWHPANLGPLLPFKSNFWHQPPTCLQHCVSNKFPLSKWQRLRGTVFRRICVCSVWISPFEESNGNAKWWRGRRLWRYRVLSAAHVSLCPRIGSGGLEGFRGLFPLRISFVLALCHVLPASWLTDFKGVGGDLTGIYYWPASFQVLV